MNNNENLTSEQVSQMSDEEWQTFRQQSWNNKKEYYAREVPSWYLRSQESFIQFLEKKQSKFRK